MGEEQDEREEVNRSNAMKNFLASKVKEVGLDFESTLFCKT